jgi:hypothetical protein
MVRIHLPPPKSQRTFSPLQLNGPGRGAHRGIGRTIQGHDSHCYTPTAPSRDRCSNPALSSGESATNSLPVAGAREIKAFCVGQWGEAAGGHGTIRLRRRGGTARRADVRPQSREIPKTRVDLLTAAMPGRNTGIAAASAAKGEVFGRRHCLCDPREYPPCDNIL